MRGQASVEYILVVSFALLMIVPATFIFYQYSADTKVSLVGSQVYKLGSELIVSAELMYAVGEQSWQTLDVTFPASVSKMTVYTGEVSELVLVYGSPSSEVVFFTNIALSNGSNCPAGCDILIHPGHNRIRVDSEVGGMVHYTVVG